MAQYRIAVLDDDEIILKLLEEALEAPDCGVSPYRSISSFRKGLHRGLPDLLILDVSLPDGNGFELLKQLKQDQSWRKVPVVLLSGEVKKGPDIVEGIGLGADDYELKPFSPEVLVAKVRAILRRLEWERKPPDLMKFGLLEIDPTRRQASLNGKPIELTRLEFNLLTFLARSPDTAYDRQQLLKKVWGVAAILDTRTVDKHIQTLREKLGPLANCIETVPTAGYRFHPPG